MWENLTFHRRLPVSAKIGSLLVVPGVLGGCPNLSHLRLSVILLFNRDSFQTLALLDSDCEQSLIHANVVKQLNLPLRSLPVPMLDGKEYPPISKDTIEMELISVTIETPFHFLFFRLRRLPWF